MDLGTYQMTTTVLTKEDIDWGNLGFDYKPTTYRFVATYKDGAWSEGELITSQTVQVHEGSTSLHYGQQCFEGMKAQTAKDGRVLLFRPELNAAYQYAHLYIISHPSCYCFY